MTSASITRRSCLVRSWLRSSRAVSVFGSIVLRAAGEKARDQHALESRDVDLRLDRHLDRHFVEADAARRREREATG